MRKSEVLPLAELVPPMAENDRRNLRRETNRDLEIRAIAFSKTVPNKELNYTDSSKKKKVSSVGPVYQLDEENAECRHPETETFRSTDNLSASVPFYSYLIVIVS